MALRRMLVASEPTVDTTKTELSQTRADLKSMTGDMGVMSGLIATNSTELATLRKLGEKDYYEFTLPRNGGAQKVGDIQLALKKADVKRNKFTLDVMTDDKRVEKKDKNLNEPVAVSIPQPLARLTR